MKFQPGKTCYVSFAAKGENYLPLENMVSGGVISATLHRNGSLDTSLGAIPITEPQTGVYRATFDIPDDWEGDQLEVVFLFVEAGSPGITHREVIRGLVERLNSVVISNGDAGVPSELTRIVRRADGKFEASYPLLKQPEDDIEIAVDFGEALGENELVQTVSAVVLESGSGLTSTAIDDAANASVVGGRWVKFRVAAGTSGTTYRLRVVVVTDADNTQAPDIYVKIQDG